MSCAFNLIGHEYRYAVDQTVAALNLTGKLDSVLSAGNVWATASCRYNGYTGYARCRADQLTDSTAQKIIKTSIYRAFIKSGMERPPWGALTGVRPGKLMRKCSGIKEFMNEYDVSYARAKLCEKTTEYTISAENTLSENDACLYIGIPFCPTRCAYCSFVSSSVEKSMKLIPPFVEALKKEIESSKISKNIVSIYFGGGTPTTLNASQLSEILTCLENRFDLSNVRDFTVEAGRPDTITIDKLEVLKKHGVNRVSVNPQTMSDSVLNAIGRKHTAKDVLDALEMVRSVGNFDINMDLIAGLPTDTADSFKMTIDKVIALSPENITVHTLSLKNGSTITIKKTELPSAQDVGLMLDYAYEKLEKAGYTPYYLYRQKNMSGGFENTGWTRPGHDNLYNICMMEELTDVYAFGAGGSSKIITDGKIERKVNPKYPLEYIEKYV